MPPMTVGEINDESTLQEALGLSTFVLLKHSHRCSISAWAFEEVCRFASDHPELPCRWLDVVHHRPLSDAIAASTGVRHASPQALLLVDGEVVWSATHGQVTYDALEDAARLIPSSPPDSGSPGS